MTAPRLSLDHARSFEVPCRWKGEDAVLHGAVIALRPMTWETL